MSRFVSGIDVTPELTMIAAIVLAIAAQAAPDPGLIHYFARVDYRGPGTVCGAAFSFLLGKGEMAILKKPLLTVGTYSFQTQSGFFSIYESPYTTFGGTEFKQTDLGRLLLKDDQGHSRWVYRDNAPGSTDVYGPAVDGGQPTPALNRVMFGPPKDREGCLKGLGSDDQANYPLP